MDNPERLLHHVTEIEPGHKILLPGGSSSGVRRENAAQLALTGCLLLLVILRQSCQVQEGSGLTQRCT